MQFLRQPTIRMPIAPAYSWQETDEGISITLDGPFIKDQDSLFCGDRVVKLNAPPYLLTLDLHGEVEDDIAAATVSGRTVTINLKKVRSHSLSLIRWQHVVLCLS